MIDDALKSRVKHVGRRALENAEAVYPKLTGRLRSGFKRLLPASRHRAIHLDPATLPWLEREDPDIAGYVDSLRLDTQNAQALKSRLQHWCNYGYAVLPAAVEPELIDALLEDVRELFSNPKRYWIRLTTEAKGTVPARALTPSDLAQRHIRILDFHNNSVAAKNIALHPALVGFLAHVFREQVVAMQSLTFMHSSEQSTHKDIAYVVPRIPSHLAASWVALEDIGPDAGPLGYYPGSHRLPNFDFGDGIFFTSRSTKNEDDFRAFLESQCGEAGIALQTFLPRKGDVFVWHGALAHRGCPQNNPNLSRRAFATHYSTVSGYPFDRRRSELPPIRIELNGALIYGNPHHPEEEGIFPLRRALTR